MKKNSIIHRIVITLSVMGSLVATASPARAAHSTCSAGIGSVTVTTEAELLNLAGRGADPDCADDVVSLGQSLTLTTPWTAVSDFTGIFDGNSNTISGLVLTGNGSGLFDVGDDGATIKNLTVNVSSSAGTSGLGALVHESSGSLTIDNVDVSGNVVGSGMYVGGFVGRMSNFNNPLSLSITNSSMSGTVSGSDFVAGLVGSTDAATVSITNTTVTGNVTGTANYVGGLIGQVDSFSNPPTVTVDSITVTGNVTGSDFVAGLIGSTNGDDIDISNITVDGNVTGDDNYIAGLIGSARNFSTPPSFTVTDATITGNVSGESYVAGLIGDVNPSVLTIDDITIGTTSPVDGNITGTSGYVGGLIGNAQDFGIDPDITITETTINGNIAGTFSVAGIIGSTNATPLTITTTNITGNITGSDNYVGGLIGNAVNFGATPIVTIGTTNITGNITGTGNLGGLIGSTNATQLNITTTNITGDITGSDNYVAGLIGSVYNNNPAPTLNITGTTRIGNTTGTGNLGGLIGNTNATQVTITTTNITGDITGSDNYTAGLIGSVYNNNPAPTLNITGTTLTGNITSTGSGNLGGLIGSTNATQLNITTTNIAGNTTGTGSYIGGLVGSVYNNSVAPTLSITGTTRTGNTTGTTYLGGLIGSTNATQLNITTTNITGNTTGTGSYIGGVVGSSLFLSNTTSPSLSISGTKITGSISGTSNNPAQPSDYVGGLVGASDALTVTVTSATISGGTTSTGNDVGGLIGLSYNSYDGPEITVTLVELTGGVEGGLSYVGGLIGNTNADAISVDTAFVSGGTRTAGLFVGGLIGSASSQSNPNPLDVAIEKVTVVGDIEGNGDPNIQASSYVGGLIGTTNAPTITIDLTSMGGNVTATGNFVGGFIGNPTILTSLLITESSMYGDVAGDEYVGGLLGLAFSGTISTDNFFVRGSMTGSDRIGGFAGMTNDPVSLTNSYFQGTTVATSGTNGSFVGNDPMFLPTLTINDSFCTDADCPNANKVQFSQLKSSTFLKSRGWDMTSTWCVRSDLNDGFPVLRNITSGALDSTPCRPVIMPIRRITLDPSGGSCVDGVTRNEPWNSVFVGYRYLPGPDDCTRSGYTLAGWAERKTPTTVIEDLPLLTDPASNTQRYFIYRDADLVAVWTTEPTIFFGVTDWLCRNCGILLFWNASSSTIPPAITNSSGSPLCTKFVVTFGDWTMCHEPTATRGTYTLTTKAKQLSTTIR